MTVPVIARAPFCPAATFTAARTRTSAHIAPATERRMRSPGPLGRRRDADVTKRGPLREGVVVRTHEQADVDCVGERDAGESLRDRRIAGLRHRHEIDAIAPLELDDGIRVREAVGRLGLLRHPAGLPPELKRHQAVAVQRRRHMRAARVERGANRPADLAMLLHARADEARTSGEDKVPAHPFPDKMKIVAGRSEEHTSELQSPCNIVCSLLLEKKKKAWMYRFLIIEKTFFGIALPSPHS